MIIEKISSFVLIIIGCLAIIFNKQYAKKIISTQNKTWGFNFGEKEIRGSRLLIYFMSFILIIIGILEIAEIIKF